MKITTLKAIYELLSQHVPKREEAKTLGVNLKDLAAIADHFGPGFVLIGVAL